MKARTRTRATRTAGRTGVGLALAATTVAAMTVPAGAAGPAPAGVPMTVGATALAPTATVGPVTPLAPMATYRVQAGDTVSAIAARSGSSVAAIVSANNLNSRALIKAGQVLRLPSPVTSSAPAATAATSRTSSSTHTVRSGDTVSALAKQYGSTVSAIVSANDLNSRALIIVGQRLTIPGSGDSSSSAGSSSSGSSASTGSSSSSSSSSSRATSHTVRSGETVSALAARYGTSVSAIVSANNLRNAGLIYVGQRLTIPGASSGNTTPASNSSGQLVGNTFLGRTYASNVVAAANANKAALLAMDVPSRAQMRTMVRDTAVRMGVDPSLALAVAHQESGFDARAVSPANAVGTMQVIPSSGEWASDLVGRKLNLLNPQDNVTAGVAILHQLMRTADNFDQAVAGYYQGLAGVKRNGMYADTRNYVAGIKNLMRQY